MAETPDEPRLAAWRAFIRAHASVVDRMVAAGVIERQACPTDRRGAFAALTPEGLTRLRRARPVHLRGIQEHFAVHIHPDEVDPVRAALERVLAAGQEPSSPG